MCRMRERLEVMLANKKRRGQFHGLNIHVMRRKIHRAPIKNWTHTQVIAMRNFVAISFFNRVAHRIEIINRQPCFQHAHVPRQTRVQRGRNSLKGNLCLCRECGNLRVGVHARVRSAGSRSHNAHLKKIRQRLIQLTLNGSIWRFIRRFLALPAMKVGALIGNSYGNLGHM